MLCVVPEHSSEMTTQGRTYSVHTCITSKHVRPVSAMAVMHVHVHVCTPYVSCNESTMLT